MLYRDVEIVGNSVRRLEAAEAQEDKNAKVGTLKPMSLSMKRSSRVLGEVS